jgi:1-acyl-sn-glycerol-3-phosphate acyltransferase
LRESNTARYQPVSEEARGISALIRFNLRLLNRLRVFTDVQVVEDSDPLPATGGCIAALNHESLFDAIAAFPLLKRARYLAKHTLFRFGFGRLLRSLGLIPVERGTSRAKHASTEAVLAVKAGDLIGIFTQGTTAPELDTIKPGVVFILLESGAPLYLIGLAGTALVKPPGTNMAHWRFGHHVRIAVRRLQPTPDFALDDEMFARYRDASSEIKSAMRDGLLAEILRQHQAVVAEARAALAAA